MSIQEASIYLHLFVNKVLSVYSYQTISFMFILFFVSLRKNQPLYKKNEKDILFPTLPVFACCMVANNDWMGQRKHNEFKPSSKSRSEYSFWQCRGSNLAGFDKIALFPRLERHMEIPLERFAKQSSKRLLCRQLRCQFMGRHYHTNALANVWHTQREKLGQTSLY